MDTHIYETIQQYLDGHLDGAEAEHVRRLIATDKRWQQACHEMKQLDQLLHDDTQMLEPSMRFTQNVMDDIKAMPLARPASAYVSNAFFKTIMTLLGGGLTVLMFYMFSTVDFGTSSKSGSSLPALPSPEISWSFLTNSQLLMVVAVINIIGLLVLADIMLSRRRQKLMQH